MAKGDYGFNATIACPGLGRRKVRVIRIEREVSMISGEDEGKRRRALYPQIVTSSGFEMDIAFVSYAERARFNRWISNYMEQVVDGTAKVGVLTVSIPHLDFVQVCVPKNTVDYGEGLTDLGYTLRMDFKGASDPIDLDLGARQAGLSYFKAAQNNTTSRYFYPAARQVAGAESLDGTIFDTPEATPPYAPGAVTPITDEGPDPAPRGGGRPW